MSRACNGKAPRNRSLRGPKGWMLRVCSSVASRRRERWTRASAGRARVAADLSDDLVSAHEKRRRHRKTQHLCGLQIDDELKCCRPLDGEIGGPRPFLDAGDIG